VKLGNCRKLALSPIRGVWFRAIEPRHAATPLQTSQSVKNRSRFSPGPAAASPFEILYLAENPTTALFEVRAVLGLSTHPVVNPDRTKNAIVDVQVKLQSVADLTDPAQLKLLDVSIQELTGNWNSYLAGDAPTQRLGAALFATKRVEGFLATSAPASSNRNLIVFPRKLLKGSDLVFEDESPSGTIHRIVG
jgi:RES domain-containing protein